VIGKSEKALELLPESEIVSRSTVLLNLGLVYWHEGSLREATPTLIEAQYLALQVDNQYADLTVQIFLARTRASQGLLRQAEGMLRKTLQIEGKIPILALAHYDLAAIYYEWHELTRAGKHLEEGLHLSVRGGNVEFQHAGHILKACLKLAKGDMSGAITEAETARALSVDFGRTTQARSLACLGQVNLATGDLQTAARWIELMPVDVDVNSFYRFIGLMKARLLLADENKSAARELLQGLLARAEDRGWRYAVVAIHALRAQAAEMEEEALGILAESLTWSQPEGFIRSYVDSGTGLIPLLHETARRGIMPDYVGQILSAYDEKKKQAWPLVEPLSEREMEVLRLVTAGLSNREIANHLVISTGTAKTHVHNICGKLDVRNRTEAAVRAKELGLV
jgi:LuxR family maltose regulon positive regulatory protein